MYRTIAKEYFVEFWEFDSIITQTLSDILRLSCAPKRPSHHVSENLRIDHFTDTAAILKKIRLKEYYGIPRGHKQISRDRRIALVFFFFVLFFLSESIL